MESGQQAIDPRCLSFLLAKLPCGSAALAADQSLGKDLTSFGIVHRQKYVERVFEDLQTWDRSTF